MSDITNVNIIFLKGFLFLCGCMLSTLIIIMEHPTLKTGFLLACAIWCGARFYYFMFYVIEKYVDGNFKYAGIMSFIQYLIQKRKSR